MAAVVTLLGTVTFDTNSGTKTVTATPAVGDLIVIITAHSGNTSAAAPTDNNSSGTYTAITSAVKAASVDTMSIYVRNSTISSASSTIFTHAPGTSTGGGLVVLKVTGMARSGSSAALQSAIQSNQAAGTPAPSFGIINNPSTNNAIVGAVFNATNPATMTPRTNFTERADVGYLTPTTGLEVMSRNSGEIAYLQTWGSSSASAFASLVVELDTSVPFSPNQQRFRFYNDDGNLGTATPAGAENTNITVTAGAGNKSFHLDIQVQETGGTTGQISDNYQLQYSKNSGTYTNVTTTSSNVVAYDSTNLTDGGSYTAGGAQPFRLTAGTGGTDTGEVCEDGLLDGERITANNYTELVYTVRTVDADLTTSDTLDFRLLVNGVAFAGYTVTPRITISAPPAPTITSPSSHLIVPYLNYGIALTADQTVTWTKTGGANSADFTLAGSTISLGPVAPRATKVVQVTATNGGQSTNQTITVNTVAARRQTRNL